MPTYMYTQLRINYTMGMGMGTVRSNFEAIDKLIIFN